MALITTIANQCDLCSHIWLGKPDATHCANNKCRSRRWNATHSASDRRNDAERLDQPLAPPRTEARPKAHDRPTVGKLARPAKGETRIASAINSPAEAQRVVAQVAATRRSHDPKTCRNRYCLVCAAMKEKP